MQPQFTDKAKTALMLAERAARSLRQSYVGSEHILIGLLRENTGVAATVLLNNGVDIVQLKEMIRELIVPESSVLIAERDGYSPRAQSILEEAHRQDRNRTYSAGSFKRRRERSGQTAQYHGNIDTEIIC